jgi:iron complex transport system permease protein
MKKKIALFLMLGVLSIIAGITAGSVFISPKVIVEIILGKIFPINFRNVPDAYASIIWYLRLPRALLAFLVGAALAVSGSVVQSVLKNPLASPFTLGVSSGASLGAGIVIVTGFTLPLVGAFTLPLVGFTMGLLTVILAVSLASRLDKSMESNTIILAGMVFSLFINAILTLISGISHDQLSRIALWQMGSFSLKGWPYVDMMLPILAAGLFIICWFSHELDLLTFGDEQAQAIGVETKKVKWLLLGVTAALTGSAVAFSGVIGFIDLVAPHIVRKFFGSQHRYVLPMSAVFGGIFMVIADIISRTVVSPSELPIGAVTALMGAPFFAYVYFKRERKR